MSYLDFINKLDKLNEDDMNQLISYIKSGSYSEEDHNLYLDIVSSEGEIPNQVTRFFQDPLQNQAHDWQTIIDNAELSLDQENELYQAVAIWAADGEALSIDTKAPTNITNDAKLPDPTNNPNSSTSNSATTVEETTDDYTGYRVVDTFGLGVNGNAVDSSNRNGTLDLLDPLQYELSQLEGILGQDPETGARLADGKSLLGDYSTRLFGAPFQFLDSVDRRFGSINGCVGNEYLRNFLLNSPILSIRPGMPQYTGDKDATSLINAMRDILITTDANGDFFNNVLDELAKGVGYGGGKKLQRRMFGFRETHYQYMQYVNYMCRSTAVFLGLTASGTGFPDGTFMNTNSSADGWMKFDSADWQNYRMMNSSVVMDPIDYLADFFNIPTKGNTARYQDILTNLGINGGPSNYNDWRAIEELGIKSVYDKLMDLYNSEDDAAQEKVNEDGYSQGFLNDLFSIGKDTISEQIQSAIKSDKSKSWAGKLANKVTCVQFMVEPGDYTETLTNVTANSVIESTTDAINEIGAELAFITNSSADTEFLGGIISFLGDTTSNALLQVSQLVGKSTNSGFLTNLFSGAIRSLKGQKMIYPQIYKSSNSAMNHEFDITLTSPYGDVYNYYMNIVVPLLHLVALAAPRMVTSNSVSSPFLVQAYIPGMCTCQLGIIQSMTIQKNPTGKHVSVNGFPLTVKVHFVIQELYNALSISPANDPASFLFNETLNDYLANMSGLIPSIDTYTSQRINAFSNMRDYLTEGEWFNDLLSPVVEGFENAVSPFN